ncbi:Glycosyltransferase AglD [uncultured archaeon]|nr:Glycosyltransferase AglD [uncultured archaeon]
MISVIVPLYNEEENAELLYKELADVLKKLKDGYEIIFIDDGSRDRTCEILEKISKSDKKAKVIQFRRNFGQTAAVQAGIDNASGDIIITMDGDLQNDPQDIPKLLEKINEGYDIVSGWRYNRNDSFQKKIFSRFSNRLARYLTGIGLHDFGCSLKAYRKDVIKDIRLYGEMHRYIPAVAFKDGAKIAEIKVEHRRRKFGKSKYGMGRLMRGFLDLLYIKFWMDYSARPLHLFGFFGTAQILLGILFAAYNLARYGLLLQVGPLLLLSIFLVSNGVLFVMFGFMGEIIVRTYYASKGETYYKIKKVVN